MGRFVIKKVASGVKFDLRADNGEVIATSEVYRTEAACRAGIRSVQKNAPGAGLEDCAGEGGVRISNPKFQLYQDRAGAFRFRLRARNGGIIAVSEGYSTRAACLAGVESVRRNARVAHWEGENGDFFRFPGKKD